MEKQIDKDYLLSIHAALGGMHSTIISARFAVAGLYVAASAFLVTALPSDGTLVFITASWIALLGLSLTVALWLLEIRNVCLLENLDDRGRFIEDEFKSCASLGFFHLMANQPIGPKIPFFPRKASWSCIPYGKKAKPIMSYIFSHSTGLSLIYLFGVIFWGRILLIS